MVYYSGTSGLTLCMSLMFHYCKNTSLACNIKDYEAIKKAKKDDSEPDLKPREKVFAVEKRPNVFDYISYMYFCGSAVCGPWFEYKDLMDFFKG